MGLYLLRRGGMGSANVLEVEADALCLRNAALEERMF